MPTKTEQFNKTYSKTDLPEIRPGDTVKVYQKIKEKDKERIQVFEGLVIARKHGKGINSTITVRKVSFGVGVERIFPVHSPKIEKIEIIKRSKVRRAKLSYIREAKGKKARLKRKEFASFIKEENPKEAEEESTAEKIEESPEIAENNNKEEQAE